MKRFLKSLARVIFVIILLFVGFLWYAGFFERVYLTEKETGPYYALITDVGFYEDPTEVRNEIFNVLQSEDIISEKAVAISNKPFRENIITKTGWLVESKNVQLAANIAPAYRIIEIPEKRRIVADFPYNNSFSIMSGSYIVYRKLLQHAQKRDLTTGRIFEIYDDANERIFYHLNIKQVEE